MRCNNDVHSTNSPLRPQIYLFWRKSFFSKKSIRVNNLRLSFAFKRTLLLGYQPLLTLQVLNNTTNLVNVPQQVQISLVGDSRLWSTFWKTLTCFKILLSNYLYFQFFLFFKVLLFLTGFDENGFFFNFSKRSRTLPSKVISFLHIRYI